MNDFPQIRILLVDNDPRVNSARSTMFEMTPDLKVVGCAVTGREAIEQSNQLRPDVILMDVQMPELNGIEAAKQILQSVPSVKVLFLTTLMNEQYYAAAQQIGASGYVLKEIAQEQLEALIRSIHTQHERK